MLSVICVIGVSFVSPPFDAKRADAPSPLTGRFWGVMGRGARRRGGRGVHVAAGVWSLACPLPPLAHSPRAHDFSTTFEYAFDSVGESSMPSFPSYLAALGDAATPFAVPAVAGFTDAE